MTDHKTNNARLGVAYAALIEEMGICEWSTDPAPGTGIAKRIPTRPTGLDAVARRVLGVSVEDYWRVSWEARGAAKAWLHALAECADSYAPRPGDVVVEYTGARAGAEYTVMRLTARTATERIVAQVRREQHRRAAKAEQEERAREVARIAALLGEGVSMRGDTIMLSGRARLRLHALACE